MKQSVMAFFFVALVLGTSAIAQTSTVTIDGYVTGDYKVNDDVERQITAKVVEPIHNTLSTTSNGKISILVYGYTDKKGTVRTNDDLGEQRAEQVAKDLLAQFPDASIIPSTKGDMADARIVTVMFKVTAAPVAPVAVTTPIPAATPTQPPSPPPAAQDTPFAWKAWLVGVALLALVAVLFYRARPVQPQPAQQAAQPAPAPAASPAPPPVPVVTAPEPVLERLTFKENGCTYEALITRQGKGGTTPFTIRGVPIFRGTERELIKSLKSCVAGKNKEFKGQLTKLIAEGKVKITEGVPS